MHTWNLLSFRNCKLRNKIYGRFTVSRSCKAFKTLVTLITLRWQVTCWHFWKMSVGYSGSSRFLPMFSHPWATLIVEACRSGFSYSLSKEWISSWKTQVTGKRAGGDEVSLLENACWVHWRPWLLCQGKLHGQELLKSGRNCKAETLFLTPSQRQHPFWKMVSMLDSCPTHPLIYLLWPSLSPSLGQNIPQKCVQAPPSSRCCCSRANPIQRCVSE